MFVVSAMLKPTLLVVTIFNVSSVVFGKVNVDVTVGHPYAVNYLHSFHN